LEESKQIINISVTFFVVVVFLFLLWYLVRFLSLKTSAIWRQNKFHTKLTYILDA
jgi:hypothetical protein